MSQVSLDMSEIRDFFKTMKGAEGDFKKDLETFLDGIGNEFLRLVEEEIIRRKVMDTRTLLSSFHKGGGGNVWKIEDSDMTLEVGSSVEYAGYVNDGHWLNPKGVARRFVPGYWEGHRFIYDPGADTGMLLKQKWVEGAHYFESALRIMDRMFPELLGRKLDEWLNTYFS